MARSTQYTDRSRFDDLVGPQRAISLLDFNRDQAEDDGVFDSYKERAANRIDTELRQKYTVPFTAFDDPDDPCDPAISDLCDWVILLYILQRWHPGGEEYEALREELFGEDGVFAQLRAGEIELDEAAVGGEDGAQFIKLDSIITTGPTFALKDSTGKSRMKGF